MSTGKIIVYTQAGFQGAPREFTKDNAQLGQVGSVKVIASVWVGYGMAGFAGTQYLLEEGEYAGWQTCQGCICLEEFLQSAKKLPIAVNPTPTITLFDNPSYGGRNVTVEYGVRNLGSSSFMFNDMTSSIKVLHGTWVLYKDANYCGTQYIIPKGNYPNWAGWDGSNNQISSLRPVTKSAV